MELKKLIELQKEAGALKIIVSDGSVLDETYAEKGMVGKIVSIEKDYDDVYKVAVDWNGFESTNEPLEDRKWYLDLDKNLGTMKEAGLYPSNGIEEYYFGFDYDTGFEVADKALENAIAAFNSDETTDSFSTWLAKKAGF